MYEERFARLKKHIAMASVSSLDFPVRVDGLPKQQAEVLRTRFIEGLTMKETGVRMEGLPKDSVRQIQSKALMELRHSKAARQLMLTRCKCTEASRT